MGKFFKNKALFYTIISILILLLILFILSIIYYFINNKITENYLNNPNIYNDIYVENINISNLSKENALATLKNQLKSEEKITLILEDREFVFKKQDLGFEYDFEKAIENAYNIGRTGTKKERLRKIKELKNTPLNLKINYKLNDEKLNSVIYELEKVLNKEPIRGTLIKNGENFQVVSGKSGLKLNRDILINDLKNSINEKGDIFINIKMDKIENNDDESLKMVKDKLGTYITTYKGYPNSNRVINMKVAAQNINGTVLFPNEVFSTNKMFKPTTKENGYKPATAIINGKFVDGYGGGVCQVSSTLYNALLYSELEILERKNHSLKVGYLDYGFDATLAGDYIDLKFKNSSNYPIYIEAYLTDNQVICSIYGKDERSENRSIKFENVLVEEIPPGPRLEKETSELAFGTEKVEIEGKSGYKYKLYKLVYVDDKLVDKILVNTSYYKPRNEEVLIGNNKELVQPVINLKDTLIEQTTENETIEIESESTTFEESNATTEEIIEITTEQVIETTIEEIMQETEQIAS